MLQEKMDHLGIVALVLGTPITAVMSHTQGGIPLDLQVSSCLLHGLRWLPVQACLPCCGRNRCKE